jgi:hypothetical protein
MCLSIIDTAAAMRYRLTTPKVSTIMTISNRVTVSKSVLAGGAAIAAIVQAQTVAENAANAAIVTETDTIAAKQASIIAAATFVAKHWKNETVWFLKGNGTKPEQRFTFFVRSLALPEADFEYGGVGSDMLSRLNTIGSNPVETKAILKDGKAVSVGSLAKRVAAAAKASKAPIETNAPLETASNPDGSGDAALPSTATPASPDAKAGHALDTFLAICRKHNLDAVALMTSAIQALEAATIEPDAEAIAATA